VNPQELTLRLRDLLEGDSSRLVLLLLVGLVVVALVAIGLWLARLSTPSGRARALLDDRARRVSRGSWVPRLVGLGIVLLALLSTGWYLQRPQTCVQCHSKGEYVESVAESTHPEVDCMDCHANPGPSGLAQAALSYGRWFEVYAVTRVPPVATGAGVDNAACLSCHDEVARETVEAKGIRVRHSDFLDEGALCGDCHNTAGHGDMAVNPTVPEMDSCFPCHDGEVASAECEVCHVGDITATADPADYEPVKTVDAGQSCYGCHPEDQCLSCHGVSMPHPAGWSDPDNRGKGTHVRQGFSDRELCWRCHHKPGQVFVPEDESCRCHGLLGEMHGGEAWVAEHGLQATGQKTGEYADCKMCHGSDICNDCHPPSYNELYNPRPGYDQYTRSVPRSSQHGDADELWP
jgi:trimethylamine-N-oxide reductase cytochrome c-type subunit TorC